MIAFCKQEINYYFSPTKIRHAQATIEAKTYHKGYGKKVLTLERAYCRNTAPTASLHHLPMQKRELSVKFSFWCFWHSTTKMSMLLDIRRKR